MKPLRRRHLLIGLSVIGCAAGAAPSALAAPSPGQRVYAIEMLAAQRFVAVSSSEIHATIAATQTRMAPCAEEIAGSITSQGATAAEALERELGEQYVAQSLAPIFVDAREKAFALSQVPSSSAFLAANRTFRQSLTTLVSLNACADFRSWEKTGFTAASEPVGIRFVQRPLAAAPTPTMIATSAQISALNAEIRKGQTHYAQLYKQVAATLVPWLASLPVQSTPIAPTKITS